MRKLTSPIARYLVSGLNDTHVADLTRSLAAHVLPPGESPKSGAVGVPSGELGVPRSLVKTVVLLRRSAFPPPVGVLGSYMLGLGFNGAAVGRAL